MDREELKRVNKWFRKDAWPQLFRALKKRPDEAELATWICDCLIDMLESGEEGVIAAVESLRDGIRLGHPFTTPGKLAVEQYRLAVKTGHVSEWPRAILQESIERMSKRIAEDQRPQAGPSPSRHRLTASSKGGDRPTQT